jgi:hypothetical protein
MALAKLWAVFDDAACEEIALEEVGRIREAYRQAFGEPENNPIIKVRLEILNVDGRLQVVMAANASANNNGDNGEQEEGQEQQEQQDQGNRNVNNGQVMALSQYQHQELLGRLDMLQAEQQAQRAWMQQMFDRVITNQQCYGGTVHSAFARADRQEQQRRDLQQVRAAADAANNANAEAHQPPRARQATADPPAIRQRPRPVVSREAKLASRPRCLYELWQEYQFGIGNNKPAKNFTTPERNANRVTKQKYHYRNKVWKLQRYMLNAGWTVEGMNTEITRVYNCSHVSAIVKAIVDDSKNVRNPMVDTVGFRINWSFFAGVTR